MKAFLAVAVVAAVLWWLSRRASAAQLTTNVPTGTAPDSTGQATTGGPPGIVPNAYNPPDPRDSDPIVQIARAAGLDNSIIPVLTVGEAVARSQAAGAAADSLRARLVNGPPTIPPDDFVPPYPITADMPLWYQSNLEVLNASAKAAYEATRGTLIASASASPESIEWAAAQQADVAANPWYASTGYNGDAAAVAGQIACGAKSSGNPMGRILDSSFCPGGPHYGADPTLSTGLWP